MTTAKEVIVCVKNGPPYYCPVSPARVQIVTSQSRVFLRGGCLKLASSKISRLCRNQGARRVRESKRALLFTLTGGRFQIEGE
jgi:hypothetical protein